MQRGQLVIWRFLRLCVCPSDHPTAHAQLYHYHGYCDVRGVSDGNYMYIASWILLVCSLLSEVGREKMPVSSPYRTVPRSMRKGLGHIQIGSNCDQLGIALHGYRQRQR